MTSAKARAVPMPSNSALTPLYAVADLLDAFAIRLPAEASNDIEVLALRARAASGVDSRAHVCKRASGYRLDAISLTNKLMTADLRDDGIITVARMRARSMSTTLEPETVAATNCLT